MTFFVRGYTLSSQRMPNSGLPTCLGAQHLLLGSLLSMPRPQRGVCSCWACGARRVQPKPLSTAYLSGLFLQGVFSCCRPHASASLSTVAHMVFHWEHKGLLVTQGQARNSSYPTSPYLTTPASRASESWDQGPQSHHLRADSAVAQCNLWQRHSCTATILLCPPACSGIVSSAQPVFWCLQVRASWLERNHLRRSVTGAGLSSRGRAS